MSRLRPRLPGHSTLVAYAALFVALGGTSYAALRLPRNSVGAAQIRRGAVTSAKVRDHSLQSVDLASGVVTRGPAGPGGADGVPGPRGTAGPTGSVGPAGSPDSSLFYDKVASDGRFLGQAAVAADSAKLGATAAGDYVRGPGSVRYSDTGVNAGSSAMLMLPTTAALAPVALEITCSDPPTSGSVRVVVPSGRLGLVTLSPNSAGSVQQQFFGPASSSSVALTTADHVSVYVGSPPDMISADMYFNAGLGGVNQCNLHGFITTQSR